MLKWISVLTTLLPMQIVQADSAVSQSSEQIVLARELLSWCSAGTEAGTAACEAYIMGIADAAVDEKNASCPGNATRSQMRIAVMRRVAQSPALDLPAMLSVRIALREAFPCNN